MKKSDTGEIKRRILSEIKKTEKRIVEYRKLTEPESPDCAVDTVLRAEAQNTGNINKTALKISEEKSKALKYMLSEVGKEDFGLCKRCNAPVPLQRLLAVPQSPFCVKCTSV
ncbi:MAG: TraR/DksA family transcriptional regulator [Chlorobi bacterium]|nr:TraR/DksA family transcriptional regulator [Chlorobiota bacterium]